VTWDDYFLGLCDAVSKNSKCLSRQIGAVIATKDHSVVSMGYNGPPRKVKHCNGYLTPDGGLVCMRRAVYSSGEGLDKCPAAHAEANAIFTAAREGSRSLKGCTIYMNCPVPCRDCIKAIIQVGIDEVVCVDKGNYYDSMSGYLIDHSGLKVRQFNE